MQFLNVVTQPETEYTLSFKNPFFNPFDVICYIWYM